MSELQFWLVGAAAGYFILWRPWRAKKLIFWRSIGFTVLCFAFVAIFANFKPLSSESMSRPVDWYLMCAAALCLNFYTMWRYDRRLLAARRAEADYQQFTAGDQRDTANCH